MPSDGCFRLLAAIMRDQAECNVIVNFYSAKK